MRDHEVALPRQGLEIRADGLWAELSCETPFEHWTYGLEAFGVRARRPEPSRCTGEIGERMPVGLDIEWEIDGPIHSVPDDWPIDQYAAPGIIHGDVLLGRERFELDAVGPVHAQLGRTKAGRIPARGRSCVTTRISPFMRRDARRPRECDGCSGRAVPACRSRGRVATAGDTALRFVSTTTSKSKSRSSPVHRSPSPRRPILDRALCRFQVDDSGDNRDRKWLVERLEPR